MENFFWSKSFRNTLIKIAAIEKQNSYSIISYLSFLAFLEMQDFEVFIGQIYDILVWPDSRIYVHHELSVILLIHYSITKIFIEFLLTMTIHIRSKLYPRKITSKCEIIYFATMSALYIIRKSQQNSIIEIKVFAINSITNGFH